MNIQSILRHAFTFLAGLGGTLLAWNLISPDQVEAVNKAGTELIEPVSVIAGVLFAGLARVAMTWIARLFGIGAGEKGNDDSTGVGRLLLWVGMTAGFLCSLPSCSPAEQEAMKAVPIRACYIDEHGYKVCYSTTEGISAEVDRRSGK